MNVKSMFFMLLAYLLICSNADFVAAAGGEEEEADKLEVGKSYELKSTSSDFEPISIEQCNLNKSSPSENCVAQQGSVFIIDKLDPNEEPQDAYLRFKHVKRLGKNDFDCNGFLWLEKDSPNCKEGAEVIEAYSKKSVEKKLLYKHDLDKLKLYAEEYEGPFSIGLKVVLIPQKIYLHNYEHSSNPTLGIAISGKANNKKDDFIDMVISVDYGIGFNQVSVETNNGLEERTGLSIFAGYNFIGEDGLNAGIYYGIDYVKLDNGDLFVGETDNKQDWLGLVFSMSLK